MPRAGYGGGEVSLWIRQLRQCEKVTQPGSSGAEIQTVAWKATGTLTPGQGQQPTVAAADLLAIKRTDNWEILPKHRREEETPVSAVARCVPAIER